MTFYLYLVNKNEQVVFINSTTTYTLLFKEKERNYQGIILVQVQQVDRQLILFGFFDQFPSKANIVCGVGGGGPRWLGKTLDVST